MSVKIIVSEHQESGLHFSMSLQYNLYIALNHFLSNSAKRKHTAVLQSLVLVLLDVVLSYVGIKQLNFIGP